jgi:phosphopantothenoylcysteine decarboxylase/phosphopantothenate--cysteine ligase
MPMTAARKLLITAGPTHEPVDAVRYIANRSSGQMGIALAAAGRDAGWDVTLLLGPTDREPPAGITTVRFSSTADLQRLLDEHFAACDVLIMAAAVADYRPQPADVAKLPRATAGLVLHLEATPDLVAGCAARKRAGQRIVGFALEEPGELAARAQAKLARKNLDAIVANPLATMGAAEIEAAVCTAAGETLRPPAGATTKAAFARWLVAWLGEGSRDQGI